MPRRSSRTPIPTEKTVAAVAQEQPTTTRSGARRSSRTPIPTKKTVAAVTQDQPTTTRSGAKAKKKKKKQPHSSSSSSSGGRHKIVSHTDDGIPIVNATMAQIRKGLSGKAAQGQLVQIPQVAERGKFYAEAAEVIGERESLALPYHGGRTWRCEVKVSDGDGACGDNCARKKKVDGKEEDDSAEDLSAAPKKKKRNYKSPTPLFRWYRGSLVLATLPYILEDVVEVPCKMPGKKRWANGLSDDELDSSDEEWDDERYRVEPSKKMTMEISALTESAQSDSRHPAPRVARTWISPDLRRFGSRKAATAYAASLVERDLLIDRTLYGYGHNGARLRPAKPTRRQALEAGEARFLRDGLWVVGQEEMWIEKRRDALARKLERRCARPLRSEEGDDGDEGAAPEGGDEEDDTLMELQEEMGSASDGDPDAPSEERTEGDRAALETEEETNSDIDAKAAARAAAGNVHPELDAPATASTAAAPDETVEHIQTTASAAASCADTSSERRAAARAAAGYTHPELDAPAPAGNTVENIQTATSVADGCACSSSERDAPPATNCTATQLEEEQRSADNSHPEAKCDASHGNSEKSEPAPPTTTCDDDDAKVVSPAESDASTDAKVEDDGDEDQSASKLVVVKRAFRTKPPPAFVPSTHYRLNQNQIDLCFAACVEHYENVMRTVQARSLHHELADGFDCFRERGRGRYDMEPAIFDTDAFSFLTDPRRAAWMPVVRKILGDDASLVHKGCFMSLPGSETQVYHQDGVHLNAKVHKPCYAINVFVPLVDCGMEDGPTEFCLGSHYLGHENFVKENVYTPCVAAGTPVVFDYRLGHRGLRNHGRGVRPVVYLTYSSMASGKEFRDSVNFSRKRYHKLGDFAERPLSREERAQKRRRQEEN